jgi:dolichol kinase
MKNLEQLQLIAVSLLLLKRKVFMKDDESTRQAVHASVDLLLCLMIWRFGIQPVQYLVLAGTCAGLLIIHLILTGFRPPVIDLLLARLERTGALPEKDPCITPVGFSLPSASRGEIPGAFAVGAMCTLVVLPTPVTVLAVLSVTILESLPLRLYDNITLPIALSTMFYLMHQMKSK